MICFKDDNLFINLIYGTKDKDEKIPKQGILKRPCTKHNRMVKTQMQGYRTWGFYCTMKGTGKVINKEYKELVSLARYILNYSFGISMGGPSEYREYIRHGLEFLEIAHRDNEYGGYHQVVIGSTPKIGLKLSYQTAFCFCCVSNAYMAGIKEAYSLINRIFNHLEERVFDKENNLYIDDASNDYTTLYPYRGQNCNMHMVEATIVAYNATGEKKYINRAYKIAEKITRNLTRKSNGLIYEHYKTNWEIDFDYNKNADKYSLANLLRPYGFLPGHWAEWAKLLLMIERYKPEKQLLETAEYLFNKSLEYSWNYNRGGFSYAVWIDKKLIDPDVHYWQHVEELSAAALALRTRNEKYWDDYDMGIR